MDRLLYLEPATAVAALEFATIYVTTRNDSRLYEQYRRAGYIEGGTDPTGRCETSAAIWDRAYPELPSWALLFHPSGARAQSAEARFALHQEGRRNKLRLYGSFCGAGALARD